MAFDSHGDVIVLSPTMVFTKLSGATGATVWSRPGPTSSSGMWLDAADSIYVAAAPDVSSGRVTTVTKYASDGTAPVTASLPGVGSLAISPGRLLLDV